MSDDHGLDQIDARGRRAAHDLRDRAATRRVPPFERDAPSLPARSGTGPALHRGRGPLLVAAAVLVLALVTTVTFGLRGDETGPAVSIGGPAAFQVVDLPEGFAVLGASGEEFFADPGLPSSGTADVYGPGPDEPALVVWTVAPLHGPGTTHTQTGPVAAIGGHDVYDLDQDPAPEGRPRAALVDVEGTWAVVAAPDRAAVEQAIAGLTVEAGRVRLAAEVVPPGWSILESDPHLLRTWIGADAPIHVASGPSTSLGATAYGPPASTWSPTAGPPDPVLLVWSRALGGELAAGRLLLLDVAEVEIGDGRGIVGRNRDSTGETWPVVVWEAEDGTLLSLRAPGFDRDEALAMARSVAPMPSAEFDDLVRRSQLGLLALDPAAIEVGQGTFDDGTGWALFSRSDADGTVFADLRVTWEAAQADGVTGNQSASAEDGGVLASVTEVDQGGRRYAAGILATDAGADRVVVRQGGEIVGEATLVGTDGVRGWAVELPHGATTVEALAPDGRVLAAHSLSDGTAGSIDGMPAGSATTVGAADPAPPG